MPEIQNKWNLLNANKDVWDKLNSELKVLNYKIDDLQNLRIG